MRSPAKYLSTTFALSVLVVTVSGCDWHGLNSLQLPGTQGGGPGAYTVQAQLPDIGYIEENSRVRVGDVNVGTVTKIERQDWHALVTMRLNGDVDLPANVTATVGQTSLLGSLHIELTAPPASPQGKLHNGSVIPLAAGGAYPNTEQTLAAVSVLLNGGGLGQIQDITTAMSSALTGREGDLRNLLGQVDQFTTRLNDQTTDIITANENLNGLVGQLADHKPVLDRAIRTIPDALAVLKDQRDHLAEALDAIGKFSALTADAVNGTKDALANELNTAAAVLESVANAGPAMTRSLSLLATFPWPKETLLNWVRGDAVNLTAIIDLTLSRLDNAMLTGTRFEGNLTELELQWGRTIGQLPSPYTAGNPLIVPYHLDQGP
ncbi:MCE family protein [Mycolicibacterium sp. CH28]|uniref:MCE family protein n=1 Tax=Mycolicibacterium sp. CH28 TaxID=2512237 RepID=UPI001080F179|nr:MCE family protein [Mycolicibacterium sp. CH28]TGD87917.1 MCE family protein [Mycolicibacterium sp. CH28]